MARFETFEELVQYIKDNVDIVDVISDYVELKRVGSQWMGRCPFHPDKNPSFSVSGEKGLYHCFGCGASGDVIKFIEDIENVSFLEALEILGERVGIDVEEEIKSMKGSTTTIKTSPSKVLKKAVAYAAQYYHRFLISAKENSIILQYLYDRGLDDADIEEWKIGFASPLKPLFAYLRDKGIDLKPFVEAGILRKDGTDTMRNRIIIPIADGTGKYVSLGGRLWKGEGPKYLNGPDSPIFKKGNILFGMHKARKVAKEKRRMIFVEGYFDVILMHKYGFAETVAPMGTALSDRLAREVASLVERAYLMFDPDAAGIKATISSGFKLSSLGVFVSVVHLPEGMDPDEYVVKYSEGSMENMLMEGMPFERFIANRLIEGISPADPRKSLMIGKRLEEYSLFATPQTEDTWKIIVGLIEKQLAIPGPELMGKLYKMKRTSRSVPTTIGRGQSRYDILEEGIYQLLLFAPIHYTYLPQGYAEDFHPHMEKLARLLRHIVAFFEEHEENAPIETFHTYLRAVDEEIAKDIYKYSDTINAEDSGPRFICLVSRWLMLRYRDLMQENMKNQQMLETLQKKKAVVEKIYSHPDLGCTRMKSHE